MHFFNLLIFICFFFVNVFSDSLNIQDKLSKDWLFRQYVVEKKTGEREINLLSHHLSLDKATTTTTTTNNDEISSSSSYPSLISGKWRINETSINTTIDIKYINIRLNNNENNGIFEYSNDMYDYKKLFEFKFFQLNKEQIYISNGEWLGFEEKTDGLEEVSKLGFYQFILSNNYFIINIFPKNDDNTIIIWTGSIFIEKEEQGWFKKNMTSWVFVALIAFNLVGKFFMKNSRGGAAGAAAGAATASSSSTSKKNK